MNNWRYIIIDHDCVMIALRFKIFAIAKQIVEAYPRLLTNALVNIDRRRYLKSRIISFRTEKLDHLPAKASYFTITILIINRMLIP